MSKAAFIKQDHPFTPRQEYYLLFDVEPTDEFSDYVWDYEKLESRQKDRMSGWPYPVPLAELLSIRRN